MEILRDLNSVVMDSSEVPDKISVMGACTIYITGEGDVAPDINIETVNGGNVVNEYASGSVIPPPGSFIEGMGISQVNVDVDSGTVDQGPYADVDLTEGTMSIAFHNICGGSGGSTSEYSIDLTQDNESLCYDPDTGRCVENPVHTEVTLRYHGEPVQGAVYSIADRVGMTNEQATISGNVVTVSGLNNSGYVSIRGACDEAELFIKFAVKKVWGYTKYYLEIDPNSVTYNRSTHELSTDNLVIKVNKSGQNDSGSIEYIHMQSLTGNGVRLYVDGTNVTSNYVNGSYTHSVTVPAENKTNYYVKITNDSGEFLDGEYVDINKIKDGEDSTVPGPPGPGIKDVKQYFKLSNNTSESYPSSTYGNPPNTSSGWYPTSDGMTVSNNSKYIWSFWRTTYEDNTWEDTGLAKVVWYDPVMTSIKQYFKLSNNTSESYPGGGDPPTGWSSSSDGLNVDSTHRYLWTFFRSWYDNGTYDDSGMARITWYDPIMTGMNQYFKLSSSESMAYPSDGTSTTPPSGWSTSSAGMSCSAQNKYLWSFFRTFYDNNTHDDSGMAKIAMYQQYVNGVIQYYKKSANATGETAPASSSGNPPDSASGWTANGNSIVLDSASPYLWSFFRTNYDGGTWEDSVPSVIRFFNAQASIDYNEVTSKVEENIGYDLDNLKLMFSGSSPRQTFADSVINLESASISTSVASAVSGTMSAVNQKIDGLSGSVSTSMVQLNALSGTIGSVSDVASAADGKATRAVWSGKYVWYKNTGSGTSATTVYKNYECPETSSQTQYENYMKSSAGGSWLGPSMSADAMSVIQQESDKIFMGVGDGTNVASSITLLKGCSTSDSKIVLDAAHVIINGGLSAGVVTASNIAAGAITGNHISASVIEGKHIKAETISGSLITGETISSSLLSAGAVTAGKVAANAVSASNIVAGTITGDRIKAETISSSLLSAGAVTAGKVAANAVSASNVVAGTITGDRIKAGTITGDLISASAITGGLIAAKAISGSNIIAGTISGSLLDADSVRTVLLTASVIQGSMIEAGTITADKIKTDELTVCKLLTEASGGSMVISDNEIKIMDSESVLKAWIHVGELNNFSSAFTEYKDPKIATLFVPDEYSPYVGINTTQEIGEFTLNSVGDAVLFDGRGTRSYPTSRGIISSGSPKAMIFNVIANSIVNAPQTIVFTGSYKIFARNMQTQQEFNLGSGSTQFTHSFNGSITTASSVVQIASVSRSVNGSSIPVGAYKLYADLSLVPLPQSSFNPNNFGTKIFGIHSNESSYSDPSSANFGHTSSVKSFVDHVAITGSQITEIANDGMQVYKDSTHYYRIGDGTFGGSTVSSGIEFRAGNSGIRVIDGVGLQKWNNSTSTWVSL